MTRIRKEVVNAISTGLHASRFKPQTATAGVVLKHVRCAQPSDCSRRGAARDLIRQFQRQRRSASQLQADVQSVLPLENARQCVPRSVPDFRANGRIGVKNCAVIVQNIGFDVVFWQNFDVMPAQHARKWLQKSASVTQCRAHHCM